ncbi:hypothetical protein [Microbacterium ulmi]|uniref:DUF3618 domain-containing protein n=1 Tax=Microbacterium ulmi TaxID=179095 RepID=A0A7Y2Q1H7_9MICO|nr:hypothetical protein [Microbacterium ulmi]NII69147.1 ElaB/YqjD/DUF883 family membrane-anchored ribosome-binding protein [Microbacterium ulmi]NNH03688.1 hypothetical protein [Microbacterium ulmi]
MSSSLPVPRTAVPLGIADPVEQARAELKAALAAIEEKANVPRRVAKATEQRVAQARSFTRANPAAATAAVVAVAAGVGALVWALVRAYTR